MRDGPVSVAFAEEMHGYLDFEESDHQRAFRAGEAAGRRISFQVTVSTDDLDRFLEHEADVARVTGWVRCDALGGVLDVERGHFNLLLNGDGRRMEYRLAFRDPTGAPLTLAGVKEGCELFAHVLSGHEPDAAIAATALLRIDPSDLAKQLTTVRVSPPLRLDALARFREHFAGDLWDVSR
jgi:cholesterol oxidase